MREATKKALENMVSYIDKYLQGLFPLRPVHDSILNMYESIGEEDKPEELVDLFHEYWDRVEVIIALKKEKENIDRINKKILPEFKERILEYISKHE